MRRRTTELLGALTAAATEEQAVQALDKLANSLRDDFVTANEGRADLKRIEPFFHQSAWGSLHARLAMKPSRSPVEDAIWQLFRMERVFCRPDR